MPLSTFALDSMLATLAGMITTASLHTAYSATGLNEVTGGDPLYARQLINFRYRSAAEIQSNPFEQVTFEVPAGVEVTWIGLWDGYANFLGMVPLHGGVLAFFTVNDTVTSVLDIPAFGFGHGLVDGNPLVVWGFRLPLTADGLHLVKQGTIYYVVNATPTTLQLATIPAGPPLMFTLGGSGFIQTWIPSTVYETQSMLIVNALFNQIILDASLGT